MAFKSLSIKKLSIPKLLSLGLLVMALTASNLFANPDETIWFKLQRASGAERLGDGDGNQVFFAGGKDPTLGVRCGNIVYYASRNSDPGVYETVRSILLQGLTSAPRDTLIIESETPKRNQTNPALIYELRLSWDPAFGSGNSRRIVAIEIRLAN